MKKFLCMTMLMLAALTASAMAQTKAASPPEQDIGYQQVATLSLDGMTVNAIHSQPNIVDWQMPVMVAQEAVTASAQVVGAVTIATPAAEVGIGLVAYRWPGCKPECTTTIDRYANFMVKVRCKDGRAQVTVNVPTLTATVASVGRSQTWNLGEAIAEMEKTSGKRRERGEEAVAYITGTADNIVSAMKAALTGSGDSDDDF